MKTQKKFSLKNNRLAKTIIISGTVLIVVAFIILRYEGFIGLLSSVLSILRPIIIGGIIAFALNRPLNFFHAKYRMLFAFIKKTFRKKKRPSKRQQKPDKLPFILACVTTYLISFAFLTGIVLFIIPQISDSINLFSSNINIYIDNLMRFVETYKLTSIVNLFGFDINITQMLEDVIAKLQKELSGIVDYIPNVLETTVDITSKIINGILDFLIGLVFSLYILLDKHKLKNNAIIVTQFVLKGDKYKTFAKIVRLSYNSFANFISGQFIEAIILGVLCFIGMSIFGFDYAPLISVIIGVTNVIPYVGPIIGTIPSAAILLLVNPIDALWFVIFIIVIQQIDSNLIYPKVVGTSVGLPALWVLVAITIGGGLGGVIGMVVGVPVLSVIYVLLGEKIHKVKSENKEKRENKVEQAG